MTAKDAPRCARCGGTDLFGPAPLRTGSHPNSASILLETPGARLHDHPLQAAACLACGAVETSLSPATLEALRAEVRGGKARRGRRAR